MNYDNWKTSDPDDMYLQAEEDPDPEPYTFLTNFTDDCVLLPWKTDHYV